jgi:hypothetical protein
MAVTLNASTATGLIATSDTSGDVALQANGTTKLTVSSTGVNIGQYNPGTSLITSGTAVASTSGTAINFTGIPSWVKRITVLLDGISTNGSSQYLIQIGDSGGIENTGYVSATGFETNYTSSTAGFIQNFNNGSTNTHTGCAVLTLLNTSNRWISNGQNGRTADSVMNTSSGSKTLSATLDRVRITTVNGTDTFDAGSINILYE